MRILFTFLTLLLYVSSSALTIAGGETFVIADGQTLYVDELEMGANSTLINNGEITISSLDLSYCYNSGASLINNGTIYCQEITMNINQWNWLSSNFTFANYGNIVCSGDIYLKVSAYCNLLLDENSIITSESFTIDKYGNQDIELLGIISSTDITIKSNDGGRVVRLGDIIAENLTFVNNATNITVGGMAYVEHLNSSTWGSSNITIDGAMIIGDIDNNSNVRGTADSFISLCVNPSPGKDFSLYSAGTVCYRVKYESTESYYWETSPKDENEITGQPTLKANHISYEQCIEGQTNFLGFKTLSQEKGVLYQEKKENVSERLKMIKYGRFKFFIKDDKLIYIKNQ